ncbi:probable plastid-lipid-associated protein 10, chloroplastic [Sesamum indicum]|uniref:Probable plastid-lipid-associated protein 10, chloroplastic n=1 Tax=Sesamum indicum TaxID=4182 RepID=A0A6I9TEW7_SESIN|nr:probable plastid-lipid-associated protein 10, chloroplastic [Sesamum indicum]
MEAASSLSLSTTPFSLLPVSSRRKFTLPLRQKPRFRHSPLCWAAAASSVPIATRESEIELENRKFELLRAVTDTQRGLTATPDQRSSIEEALVSVESFDAGKPIDLGLLDGTWRLQYTSASDVLILLQSAATLPFFEIDQIFQKFECRDQSRQGVVRNVVRWSIPRLLEEQEGATLLVSAKFSVVSIRNIYLEFEEIAIQNINISEELQALLAPAILPRSFLSLQILQFIKSFKAQVPVSSSQRRSVGGLYYLSYLDRNMLLGRAVGGGGVFIFTRAHTFI